MVVGGAETVSHPPGAAANDGAQAVSAKATTAGTMRRISLRSETSSAPNGGADQLESECHHEDSERWDERRSQLLVEDLIARPGQQLAQFRMRDERRARLQPQGLT
jgi:hypothetical protein